MSLDVHAIVGESSLKAELNRVYSLLDDLDSPREEHHPSTRLIQPIGEISLEDSVKINYKKRALSYTHGALIAIRFTFTDFEVAKALIQNVIALYNQFEKSKNIDYAKIENFADCLKNLLKPHGINKNDIQSGEKIANLERARVKKLKTYLPGAVIVETLNTAHLDEPSIQQQYHFLNTLKADQRFNPQSAQALEVYNHKGFPAQKFLGLLAHIGWALEKCGCSSNGIFSGFIKKFHFLESKKQAEAALEAAKAPDWYKKQNRLVQGYLITQFENKNLPALPATLRGIPGLPNLTTHEARFQGKKLEGKNWSIKHSAIRHGTLTPYEMKTWSEREAAALANGDALAKIVKKHAEKNHFAFWSVAALSSLNFKSHKIPVADLSFMSPTHGEAFAGWLKKKTWGKDKGNSVFLQRFSTAKFLEESNRAMKLENKEAYLKGIKKADPENNLEASSTNLGVNGDRWILSTSFRSDKYQTQVNYTIKRFNDIKGDVKALQAAGINPFTSQENENQYLLACKASVDLEMMAKNFDKSYFGHWFSKEIEVSKLINAELFASCLYALVIQGMGGTVSACCKSSKDRTGLFLLHLDAMHQYYAETGELISYTAKENSLERQHFIDIMANLYLGNTQQYMASQTTYGAFGLKEPNGVSGDLGMGGVPPDLERAISEKSPRLLEEQKDLAKANKIKF